MQQVELIENHKECCGCALCYSICPKNAISMVIDEYGYQYPKIDKEKCVECGLCKKNCFFTKEKEKTELNKTYVAFSKNKETLKNSSSGGIFAEIAKNIIAQNGVVFGCSMENNKGILEPKHIEIEYVQELHKLQGSKYVQSNTTGIYEKVKKQLETGRKVLFSGTPCQVDALKHFLKGQTYSNLYTIDIICHGVPSIKMFQDYITYLENKKDAKIIDFRFRAKTKRGGYVRSNRLSQEKQRNYKIIIC